MTPHRSRFYLPSLIALLYFNQGFPFGIYDRTLNLYLSVSKVPLATIGLLSTVGLAWTLKPLWAPLVDAITTYRAWILGSLAALTLALAAFGFVPPASTGFWIAATVMTFASATQDIAIDALSIRITPAERIGMVNSVRVTAARVAFIVAGGGLAIVADRMQWRGAFLIAALVTFLILGATLFAVPREAGGMERHENPVRALLEWLARPQSLPLLAVVLLYRLGDSALRPMVTPYWISRGYTVTEVGNVMTTLGVTCIIAGAIAGGAFVVRFGIFRGLLWLGLVQMLSNFGYAYAAATHAGRPVMYGAAVIESFCDGLGTAAFLSFLMFVCEKENAATEYAMLSAVFAISRTGAGMISGFLATDLGFARYFALTAALALPALLLLPLIRERVRGAVTQVATDA
ncbi:MAG: arabinose ABC transporter permease [Acidobacteria bacterium]|nr:MAG: arabinose ABC transporter permease [Acidobacteriota bacterium]